MQQIGGQIVWYQQLFQISLILAVILGIISVILFVSLDIKGTIGYVTGYRAKKEIKKLELDAENQSSRKNSRGKFVIQQEILLIHTEEQL